MIKNKTISLIVPCKNEAGIIAGFIRRVPKYVDEIIIVDNNSTDKTAQIARNAGAIVVCEPRSINGIGYGFAHQTGITTATGDYLVAMDGDDTYPVSEIKRTISYMERKKIDFISCNRLPLKRPQAISLTRQIGIKILNLLVFFLFGCPVKDILTGMWVMNKKSAKLLAPTSGDWNYSPEIKLDALTNPNIRFAEYHIDHFERENEPSKQQIWKTGMSHALFILKKWLQTLLINVCHYLRLPRPQRDVGVSQ